MAKGFISPFLVGVIAGVIVYFYFKNVFVNRNTVILVILGCATAENSWQKTSEKKLVYCFLVQHILRKNTSQKNKHY